ncbi:hypothetical protein LXL04_007844 [Taraxacum kok-saghyz]
MLCLLRLQGEVKLFVLANGVKTVTGIVEMKFRENIEETSTVMQGIDEEAKKFYSLLEYGNQELFPGCRSFSKLSFIFFKEVIPDAKLPASFNEAKKIVRDLGLEYKKIPACPTDCMLYWKECEHADACHICHTSIWKPMKEKQGMKHNNRRLKIQRKVPAKVVWYSRKVLAFFGLNKKHFYQLKDNQTRWKNRPKNIPENDFLQLLSYRNKKEVMKRNVRKAQKNIHTAGPKSFGRIREEMMNDMTLVKNSTTLVNTISCKESM